MEKDQTIYPTPTTVRIYEIFQRTSRQWPLAALSKQSKIPRATLRRHIKWLLDNDLIPRSRVNLNALIPREKIINPSCTLTTDDFDPSSFGFAPGQFSPDKKEQ